MSTHRTRDRVMAFRCTSKEFEEINNKITLSGKSKTDFLIDTLKTKDVIMEC